MKQVSVSLDQALEKIIKKEAKGDKTSMSQIIRMVLINHYRELGLLK